MIVSDSRLERKRTARQRIVASYKTNVSRSPGRFSGKNKYVSVAKYIGQKGSVYLFPSVVSLSLSKILLKIAILWLCQILRQFSENCIFLSISTDLKFEPENSLAHM